MPLGVGEQAAPGGVERGFVAQTGEHVEQRAAAGIAVAHVVAGGEWDAVALGDRGEGAVQALLIGVEVVLQVDVETPREEMLQLRRGRVDGPIAQRGRQPTVAAASEADQSGGMWFEVRPDRKSVV